MARVRARNMVQCPATVIGARNVTTAETWLYVLLISADMAWNTSLSPLARGGHYRYELATIATI